MLDYIYAQRHMHLFVISVFVTVTMIEMISSRSGPQVPLKDRLLNIGAGAVLMTVGSYLAWLTINQVRQLGIVRVSTMHPVAYVVLFVLIQDICFYFYHRLEHSWSFLWGLHELHHTDTDVNITTSHRTHLLEQPMQAMLVSLPPVAILGAHPTAFVYALYIGIFFLYFGHSRLNINLGPLSNIFVGPRYHRIHHSRKQTEINSNFAQFFPFLDLLFGTYTKPAPLPEVQTGINESLSYREQWMPFVWPIPLRKLVGKAAQA